MIDDVSKAVADYIAKWHDFVAARTNKMFFENLKPISVGWKTEDMVDFNARFDQLRDMCDCIVLKWLNERWIAKMHLKKGSVGQGITMIKLMQRRPGSSDAVGLDHVDFYSPQAANAARILQKENIQWTREENGKPEWISVWFAGTEAKLKSYTVLDVTIQDLQELNQKVTNP